MSNLDLGIFSNANQAEQAVMDLEQAGYNPKEISVIAKDTEEVRRISNRTGSSAGKGAATGASIGGLAGLLLGLGVFTIPGIGALLIGGPIALALGLTGVAATSVSGAVTGALAGGIVGALVGLGIPEEDAKIYESQLNQGAFILAVPSQVTGATEEARKIMEAHGATQIRTIKTPDY